MDLTYISTFPDYYKPGFDKGEYEKIYRSSNVIINASASDVDYPMHNSTLTLKTVIKGEEDYATRRGRYKVKEDNFLILNSEQEHKSSISTQRITESFSVFFYPEFVSEALRSFNIEKDDFRFIETLYKKDKRINELFTNIRTGLSKDQHSKESVKEQMHELLEYLILSQVKISNKFNIKNKNKNYINIELYKRLLIVKDYIESCYNEKITLSELAKAACLSEHYMLREFKKFFKITPHQYLTNVRLSNAVTLLSENNNSVSEISEAVGFEYLSSFSQLFKQSYKVSPLAYRTNYRNCQKVNFK